MDDEPNLDADGKPLEGTIDYTDGISGPARVWLTKRDNCVALRVEIADDRLPTDDELARYELTKEEYVKFLLDLHDLQADARDETLAQTAALERWTGDMIQMPKLERDRLGLLRPPDEPGDVGNP
jgi:hypothetical protein